MLYMMRGKGSYVFSYSTLTPVLVQYVPSPSVHVPLIQYILLAQFSHS